MFSKRIRNIRVVMILMAVVVAVASLLVSNAFTRDLKHQEQLRMEVWAEAMRSLNNADNDTDLGLVLKVINTNDLIPVVVLDRNGDVTDYRNIFISATNAADSVRYLKDLGQHLKMKGNSIRIDIDEQIKNADYIEVCYDDSLMLRRLRFYPYGQMGVVLVFVIIAIFALLISKRAEQNKVWVGLSKETAHQLGTPISSLMAWTEILKETYPDDALIPELDKDVQRLQVVADRFSKIGSVPEPKESDMKEVISHVVDYMDRRTSKKVVMTTIVPPSAVKVKMNSSLFEWVIENLCKNAVDAMDGEGFLTVSLAAEEEKVSIEITDTGKGISKSDLSSVFKPGFTTKKRGWGLGLSLAKRIVEEYHKGKIWVKKSELGKGTTFRIEIKK